ncbi:MAG: hypothetical protein II350_07555 [Clostridia bacterium]|nr:hypothetical protein [Clostridia bacterium]
MEGFDEKLEKILSSPETMARIAALAGELQGGSSGKEQGEETKNEIPDLSSLTSVVADLADDRRIGVLKALKAHADEAGGKTVDRAILAIRIAKTVKTVLPEVGLI